MLTQWAYTPRHIVYLLQCWWHPGNRHFYIVSHKLNCIVSSLLNMVFLVQHLLVETTNPNLRLKKGETFPKIPQMKVELHLTQTRTHIIVCWEPFSTGWKNKRIKRIVILILVPTWWKTHSLTPVNQQTRSLLYPTLNTNTNECSDSEFTHRI